MDDGASWTVDGVTTGCPEHAVKLQHANDEQIEEIVSLISDGIAANDAIDEIITS